MLSHPLTNFKYKSIIRIKLDLMEFTLEIIYLKIKDGANLINVHDCSDNETHWIALYTLNSNVTCFDSFGVEHIPKEIKKFIGNKNIKINIFLEYKHMIQ